MTTNNRYPLTAEDVTYNKLKADFDNFRGLMVDHQIKRAVQLHNLIDPFIDHLVKDGVISYGLSTVGYDIRISNEFRIFSASTGKLTVIDPKNFDESAMVEFKGDVCIVPPNSFALARSVEYFRMPRNVAGLCLGKSTYARAGIVTNFTPFEPCFSEDTEILSASGWKRIQDVVLGETVLGVDSKGFATYVPVVETQKYEFQGNLLHFNGRNVDLLVTPDHKLYVQKRTNGYNAEKENTAWGTVEAREVHGKYNYSFSRDVRWKGTDFPLELQIGTTTVPLHSFLKFLGLYLGDGYAYKQKGGYRIVLCCKKSRKREYFVKVVKELGFNPNVSDTDRISFYSKDLYDYVNPLGNAHEKYIPQAIKDLPPYRIYWLVEGLLESDGNRSTGMYSTVSEVLANDIQEIVFKLGKSTIIRKEKIRDRYTRQITENLIYKLRFVDGQLTPKTNPSTHRLVPYEGYVYDVTVPNHLIFVRRNGKAVWSGNCWEGHVTIEISNTTPLPAKIYANEGIAQVLFWETDQPDVSYADRKGKYQGQTGITLPKV